MVAVKAEVKADRLVAVKADRLADRLAEQMVGMKAAV